MDDINVIDRLTQVFVGYIDSGFGLLQSDVASLTTIIVTIDITLAGLFWALDANRDVIAQFLRKVLYVGFFALILNNFGDLSDIIFNSFAGLGLRATNIGLAHEQFMNPGFVAASGFEAAHPILEEIQESASIMNFLTGPFFLNMAILLIAWLLVLIAFFVMAIQLFITIIEFKITTLAGYVLVPFALWRRSAFLAERVLGNIISSGIKLMVLAIIVSIGSTFFADFTSAFSSAEDIELENSMIMVLAALSLLGLSIFIPGLAAGLVSGAPQLGAGAAIGTAAGVAAGAAAGVGVAAVGARAASAGISTAVRAGAKTAGAASMAYGLASSTSGGSGIRGAAAGVSGVAKAGAGAVRNTARNLGNKALFGMRSGFQEGRQAAWGATGGGGPVADGGTSTAAGAGSDRPEWARKMHRNQRMKDATRVAIHTAREGDQPGAPANPELKDDEE